MQTELDAEVLTRRVRIHGVNSVGAESGNAAACVGRTIPWLQDTASEMVWDLWQVTYRDVIILDPSNEVVTVFNLTTRDLAVPAEYEALKTLLREAANAP